AHFLPQRGGARLVRCAVHIPRSTAPLRGGPVLWGRGFPVESRADRESREPARTSKNLSGAAMLRPVPRWSRAPQSLPPLPTRAGAGDGRRQDLPGRLRSPRISVRAHLVARNE